MYWISKNTHWASINRGLELKKSIDKNNLFAMFIAEPMNWLSDPKRILDVIDFVIVKNFLKVFFNMEICLDADSNHVPVIFSFTITVITV